MRPGRSLHAPRHSRTALRRRPLGAVLAAMTAFAAVACSEQSTTPVAGEELQDLNADNVIYGMASYLTTEGIREGRVEADTAYMFVDSARAELRGMTIVFYLEDGRPRATVTGERGEWDQTTDAMVARGNVVLTVHEDGREIHTEVLHYDPYEDRIWSDTTTTQVLQDGTVMSGSSFESDLTFENLTIHNVRGGASPIS